MKYIADTKSGMGDPYSGMNGHAMSKVYYRYA